MWMNLADLIHNRVADRKGNTLPVDVNSVTYDLRDLTPRSYGLMANVLSIDSTLGSRVRSGYANCCSTINPGWDPSAVILGFGTDVTYGLDATDSCNGDQDDLLPDSSDWASADPSIAKVTKGEVAAVTTGSTTGSADVFVVQGVGGYCAGQLLPVTAPITVTPTITVSGSGYLAMVSSGATGGGNTTTLTASGSPSGGTYSWTAVSGGSNVTLSNTNSAAVTVQAAAVGSYTLQVTYTVNNQPGTALAVGKVQQPGSLGVVSNTTEAISCSNLPGDYTTQERLIQYQVLDTSSPPVAVQALNMRASEVLAYNSNGCDTPPLNPTTNAVTGTNGYFPAPDMLAMCSANCLPANNSGVPTGTCTNSIAQTWTVNGYAVKSDTPTFTCIGPPTGAP
jgi:hypothetical protein